MEISGKSKVSVYFDMDTHRLEEQLGKSWRNAYTEIRKYMETNDFKHEQGSVYHSEAEQTYLEVIDIIQGLADDKEWFSDCVNKISFARISDEHDLLLVLEDRQISFKFEMENDMTVNPDVLKEMGFENKGHPKPQMNRTKGFDMGK